MAPPVPKRRKLQHVEESVRGADSFAGDRVQVQHGITQEKQTPSSNAQDGGRPHKRRDQTIQDGVYTAEVYKSNMFKLQVDELLQQVKPRYGKKEAPAENAMRTLKGIIEQLPGRAPVSISEAETTLKSHGIAIPFPNPRPPKDAKYKLQYDRPSSINATGSYPLKIATRADNGMAIDLVVTMPKALFQEKDYLNHRYFYKRAYYLACLAAGIKACKDHTFRVSFDCLNGNQLQPIIVIDPSGDGDANDFSGSKCLIHILLAVPEKTFVERKMLPSSNCVRPKGVEEESEGKTLSPTPFYNATLQSDATITAYLKFLHATNTTCDAYKDACVLGRVWLKQRGFGSELRKGGFGNFEWAATMAVLLQPNPGAGGSPLSTGYSSYQLFKATLQFLAYKSLSKKPYVFQAPDVTFPKADASPIIFDGPRGLNVLFKMTPWSYSRLQLEAKSTIETLGDSTFDHFESTFILKTNLLKYRYDACLEIPMSAFGLDPTSEEYDEELVEACRKTYNILTRALTDRVTALNFLMPDERGWDVSVSKPLEDQERSILINVATDPSNANRAVDHGPAAENKKEAASFRQFWGDKAELRRFKDGSILESVVWSLKDTSAPVLEQIVLYILEKHLSTQVADKARFTSDSFAHLIPSGRIQAQSGVSSFLPSMNALAIVEKDIRALEGLPLQIRHIFAADSRLRYSTVEPPTTTMARSIHAPASIVVQFEGSARWPDDLCAIQRTKIAFLLKLTDLLSAAQPTYSARVGLENPSQPSQNQAYLDIILPSGFAFRLRIHHDREATLLDRQLKDKSLDGQSRESAASALAVYKRDFVNTPAHTQVLQTLCTRFLALSPAIRLTKRWFASHLLSPHFSSELIELLVVRTFLQPHPWPVPSCATTGFLRTLAWISRWDWRHVPLIVDFSSSFSNSPTDLEGTGPKGMKSEDIEKIQTRFEAWRRIDPAMNRVVIFAATNLDTEGTTWTDKSRPEKVVAARMTSLAKATTNLIKAEDDMVLSLMNGDVEQSERTEVFTPERLFVSQPQDYDIIIHISSKYTMSGKKKSKPAYKNLQIQNGAGNTHCGFNPAEMFARDLQSVYGDALLWFWNPENVDYIAGLWNPTVTGQRGWKVKPGWNSNPLFQSRKGSEKGGQEDQGIEIQVNKGAICNEIWRLGGELINTIDVNR
ncbi:Nrap protein [Melanomma pulvis-pyrius CBS 109.77]|uniref:U3 small nucleolar RNA-associated protein 22 n=1 Tax=Melanomma pulvis-pyrius CBS 109.77 TaxID=1314802 RepID=A0A6A6XXQ2_9PLEO|nr:Nrap protein [Melanomma pulvis-pyrius CBS 109.77]